MSTRERIVAAVCAFAFAIALVVVVLRTGFLLTNDGPAQLFNAVAAARLDDPLVAPFLVDNANVTARGFPEIVALALPSLGWRGAHQLALCIVALLTAAGAFALVMALGARRWPLAIAAGALALQHSLYLGFFHSQLGTALGLLAIAWSARACAREARRRIVDDVVLALLLYASAAAHVFAAALAGITCFAVVVFATRDARAIARVVLAGAPAALVAILARDTMAGSSEPDVWPSLLERVDLLVRLLPGPSWRGVLLWCVCFASVALALLKVRMREESPGAPRAPRVRHAFIVMGALFFAVGALGPRDIGGWQLFSIRFLPFAAALWLAAFDGDAVVARAPRTWRAPLRRAAFALPLGYAIVTIAWAWMFHARLHDAFMPLVARVEQLTPSPAWRGTISAPPPSFDAFEADGVPIWMPYWRVGSLAAIELGGVVWGFYGRAADPVALREVPSGDGPSQRVVYAVPPSPGRERDDYIRRLAALHVPRGALFASGTARDLDVIEAAGFIAEQRIDAAPSEGNAALGVLVARFEGCTARLRSHAGGTVDVGFSPMRDRIAQVDVSPGIEGESGDIVEHMGCGRMWFRFPAPCRSSEALDAEGRTYATLERGRVVDVTCAALDSALDSAPNAARP